MGRQQHYSHFSADAYGLLLQVSASLEIPPGSVLRRAIEYCLATQNVQALPPLRGKHGDSLKRVSVVLTPPIKKILQYTAIEQDTNVSRVIEAIFLQWFDEIGGALVYRLSQPPTAPVPSKKPQPKPVPAADRESIAILQQQLRHFQSTGNQLRVAQLRRELLAMGVAA